MKASRVLRFSALAVIVGFFTGAPASFAGPQNGGPIAGSDGTSVDGLIRALYETISFSAGKSPEWDRYRNLFFSASAPCVRVGADGVRMMDRESFIAFFKDRIDSGAMKGFIEREISRTTESYGGLAQVFSTYAKRLNPEEPGEEARGINAFQLFFRDGRWWIASIVWEDERPDLPIPAKYLK
jgi:hypothetical protein